MQVQTALIYDIYVLECKSKFLQQLLACVLCANKVSNLCDLHDDYGVYDMHTFMPCLVQGEFVPPPVLYVPSQCDEFWFPLHATQTRLSLASPHTIRYMVV